MTPEQKEAMARGRRLGYLRRKAEKEAKLAARAETPTPEELSAAEAAASGEEAAPKRHAVIKNQKSTVKFIRKRDEEGRVIERSDPDQPSLDDLESELALVDGVLEGARARDILPRNVAAAHYRKAAPDYYYRWCLKNSILTRKGQEYEKVVSDGEAMVEDDTAILMRQPISVRKKRNIEKVRLSMSHAKALPEDIAAASKDGVSIKRIEYNEGRVRLRRDKDEAIPSVERD